MRFLFRLFLLFVVVVALVWVFRAPILDRLGLVRARRHGLPEAKHGERPGRRNARPARDSPTWISASRASPGS